MADLAGSGTEWIPPHEFTMGADDFIRKSACPSRKGLAGSGWIAIR